MHSSKFKKIYDLKYDKERIKTTQEASINKINAGFKQTYGLFGSKEWWNSIEQRIIPKIVIEGVITKVFMSGHNDFPQFEVTSESGAKTDWERLGDDKNYIVGKKIRITYVMEEFKKPILDMTHSEVVLTIEVESP